MLKNCKILKYKIDDMLSSFPQKEYGQKLKELIEKLDVANSTLNEWRHLEISDKRDIPGQKLRLIAQFFQCDMENLFTEVEEKPAKSKTTKADKIFRKQRLTVPRKNVNR